MAAQTEVLPINDKDRLDTNLIGSLSSDISQALSQPGHMLVRAAFVGWQRVRPDKIALFAASLFLFILAITLLKEGRAIWGRWYVIPLPS